MTDDTFTYDSLGNMLTKNAQNFEYDDKFQYLKSDSEFFYAFDSNGNLIRKTSVDDPNRLQEEFIYSSENQLLTYRRIEVGSILTESNYAYDALGRRLEKKVVYPSDSSKDFTRRYMYDGGEIVTEVDGTNQVLANYTHSGLRTDDVLSVQVTTEGKTQGLAKAEGNYFYLKDSLGTITDITDSLGNLVQHFVYSPFGEIIKVTNKLNEDISSDWMIRTSYTFTNREYDEESGLYYYRARYYDASTGRFLQVDPDPGKLSVPSTHVNKYIYVGNNPQNNVDPEGKFIITALVVGAVIGGLVAHQTGGNILEGMIIGALAGAAMGGIYGAMAGTMVGAFSGGIIAAIQGEDIGKGALNGAMIGGISGGVTGGLVGYFGPGIDGIVSQQLINAYDRIVVESRHFAANPIGYSIEYANANPEKTYLPLGILVVNQFCKKGKILSKNPSNCSF